MARRRRDRFWDSGVPRPTPVRTRARVGLVLGFGAAIVVGHNLLDAFRATPWQGPGWILGTVLLYFPCRWFAELKSRRRDWLSYL